MAEWNGLCSVYYSMSEISIWFYFWNEIFAQTIAVERKIFTLIIFTFSDVCMQFLWQPLAGSNTSNIHGLSTKYEIDQINLVLIKNYNNPPQAY